MCALAAVGLAACPPRPPPVPKDLAAHGVHRIRLDTGDAHGLSGLTVTPDGAVWTVAERSYAAFRIELDLAQAPPVVRAIRRWPVTGLPRGEELESLGTLADGSLLAGTEGPTLHRVRAYRLVVAGDHLEAQSPPLTIGADVLGVDAGGNHGIEGACAVPGLELLGLEEAGRDAEGRWAPLVVVTEGGAPGSAPAAPPVVRHLRLTTETGKISALDCWRDGDRVRVVAIERHFSVTRILGFDLAGDGRGDGPITPAVLRDLSPVLRGSLNLEGLVRLPDGHLLAVVDNQYGRITGPDELIWFADRPDLSP